jgi:hypothetical protein
MDLRHALCQFDGDTNRYYQEKWNSPRSRVNMIE